jgi:hypothetical protein
MSHCQTLVDGSNASSPSSASAQELDGEERIAAGVLLHELRQRPRAPELAVQSIGDEPADILEPEGRQHHLLHLRIGLADRLERAHQRMRGVDLIFTVGADQKQVSHLRMRDQVLEQVERRGIQPFAELLQRGDSKVDQAAVYHLKVLLHVRKSENAQAVAGKRFTVQRIISSGDLWVTEFVLTYDGIPSYAVSIMEFREGLVANETQYFADRFDPAPSRAHLVERVDEITSF